MRLLGKVIAYLKYNFTAEQSRWLVWIPFLLGVGIALYFALPFEPNYWWSLGALEATLLLFYALRHKGVTILFTAILLV